ncbi:MAG TPA: bifunctional phosphoglucose/phosphomannose isomerase [Solirubrobacterales bacterium]|nr:bifunctional phosphoglucose/phosphomannose isomerase [Solirubrobacterales bacterium]
MSPILEDTLDLPNQLRDALWRIETARLEPAEAAGLIVCGMGGSAIGGDLAAAAIGDRLTRPMISVRGYELPSWTTPEWSVLCCSYSGNTEETLACFEAAGILGMRRLVVSTGGELVERAREAGVPVVAPPGIYQPRVAVAYMFATAAEAAALAGAAPGIRTEVDTAAAFVEREALTLKAKAAEIASTLATGPTVIYGSDLTAPVAHRWKTQINENAKLPAFYSELPEADHNEICGWAGEDAAGMGAVFLEDCDQHPRERRRFELTAEIVEESGATAVRLETAGETRVERLLWGVLLGDLVSLEMARGRGVDPESIVAIDRLKEGMAG